MKIIFYCCFTDGSKGRIRKDFTSKELKKFWPLKDGLNNIMLRDGFPYVERMLALIEPINSTPTKPNK